MRHPAVVAGVVVMMGAWQALAGPQDGRGSNGSSTVPRVPPPSIKAPAPRLPSTPATLPTRFDGCGCFYPVPVVHYYPPPYVFYQPIYQPVYVGPTFVEANGIRQQERVFVKPKKEEAEKPAAKPRDELVERAEAQRLIRQGNDSFAEGHYLQAARRYDQAAAAAPFEPMPYFHLAQAQLAQGKYAEAVLAIQRGMRLRPAWPQAPFQPKALYGERAGEYQQHLAQLADAVARNMNDDSLLFLLGYQLWFDERRDEAMVLFQRAALLAFDTTFVDRFVKTKLAAEPVADR